MMSRGVTPGSRLPSGLNSSENGLFQGGGDGQLRRAPLPMSIAAGNSGNALGNQRISPSFAANNSGVLPNNNKLKNNSQLMLGHLKNGNLMGGETNTANVSTFSKVGMGTGGSHSDMMFKSGPSVISNNSSNSTGSGHKRKRSNSNDKKLDMNDSALLQRLNSLGGGFPMPKWARKVAHETSGHNSSTESSKSNTTFGGGNSFYSGLGGMIPTQRRSMSIQEMMKEKKRLELERIDNMRGGFPLPSNNNHGNTIQSLNGFRQVWFQTPPEYRKFAFLLRLEKGNLIPKKRLAIELDDDLAF